MCIEFANTCAWLDLLYGKCNSDDGQLVIVDAARNRLAAVHTIGDGASLVDAAKDMHNYPGCYLKINLMDWDAMQKRKRKTGREVIGGIDEVKTLVSFHLDVDAGKSEKYVSREHALWALDLIPQPPTLVINSNGDTGGFHAYWVLARPHRIKGSDDRKRCQAIGKRWQGKLKALCGGALDSTSNLDRVLRCVGVDRGAGRVCLQEYVPSRLYTLEDLSVN